MQIKGIDISHHQTDAQMRVYLAEKPSFVFHKASEGETYRDRECKRRLDDISDFFTTGIYHYLRADKCNPILEANNFIGASKALANPHMIAIDVEYSKSTGGTADTDAHFEHFERFVLALQSQGINKIIVYIPDTYSRRWYQFINDNDLGLWIARYRKREPEHICDFWQYTSSPIDRDIFYGTPERLNKFIERSL